MTLSSILVLFCGTLTLSLANAAQDDAIAQLAKQTDTSRILLIGEMHGTNEAPAFVAQLADSVAKRRDAAGKVQPVVVALELSAHVSAHQAYFGSAGKAEDRQRMLASPYWAKPYQDGRSSAAMLELIESVRQMARGGRPIKLASFDLDAAQMAAHVDRDQGMATTLRAIVANNPSARIIALAGNYHERQSVGAPSSCTVSSYGGDAAQPPLGLYMNESLKATGYQQGMMLPQFSVSLPASASAK